MSYRIKSPIARPLLASLLLALTSSLLVNQSPLAAETAAQLTQQVQEVASFLEGKMNTSAQAQVNPKVSAVQITTCRERLQNSQVDQGSIALYQEQALMRDLSKPYRQRFLVLSASPYSQSVRSLAYRPATLTQWAGLCKRSESDRVVSTQALGQPVCSVFLRRSGSNYVGNTPVDGCPANVRGAVRITNHIKLSASGMETWDRGFDAKGKQVWGAVDQSYQFRRQ
jgi:hypothetical protein